MQLGLRTSSTHSPDHPDARASPRTPQLPRPSFIPKPACSSLGSSAPALPLPGTCSSVCCPSTSVTVRQTADTADRTLALLLTSYVTLGYLLLQASVSPL